MFCTKCGVENPDNAKFCRSCFNELSQGVSHTAEEIPQPVKYAGFWQRFAAAFIDGFVVCLFSLPVMFFCGVAIAFLSKPLQGVVSMLSYLLFYVVSAVYYSMMESGERSATYGKIALGLKVYDVDGNRISKGRGFARWISHLASYLTLYIGFLIQPFTERKQALHDMIAGTIVVDSEEKKGSTGIIIAVVAGVFIFIFVIGILAAIAIPAYQDYVTRAKVTQAFQMGEGASMLVSDYYLKTGKVPETLTEAGFVLEAKPSVADIEINPESAEISILFANNAGPAIAGKHLILKPYKQETGIGWACSSNEIAAKNLPKSCR